MSKFWHDITNSETGRFIRVCDEDIGIRVFFHVEEFQIYTKWFRSYDHARRNIEEWLSEK